VSLYLEEQRLTQRQFDLNRLGRTCDHTKRLRGREGQLIFLSSALERFRRVLDSIDDLVVSLYWHQSNDLVLTTRSVVLERAFEIDNLTDWISMHHWAENRRQFGPKSQQCAAAWYVAIAIPVAPREIGTLSPWLGKERQWNGRTQSETWKPFRLVRWCQQETPAFSRWRCFQKRKLGRL